MLFSSASEEQNRGTDQFGLPATTVECTVVREVLGRTRSR
jgi:hypothetical protein